MNPVSSLAPGKSSAPPEATSAPVASGLSRRHWLLGALATVALGCRGGPEAPPPLDPPLPPGADPLARYAADPAHFAALGTEGCVFTFDAGATDLGAACARAVAEGADPVALSQALFGTPQPPAAAEGLPALARAIRQELDAGQIRLVEGWILAPTEVRLCALAFLQGCRGGPAAPRSGPAPG